MLNSLFEKAGSSCRLDTNSRYLPSGENTGSESLAVGALTTVSRLPAISYRWISRCWWLRIVL